MMYLRLFHGRKTKDENLEGWGTDGPVLRIEGLHVTYMNVFRVLPPEAEDWHDLRFDADLFPYGGTLYGDWSIIAPGSAPDLEALAVPFDPEKNK